MNLTTGILAVAMMTGRLGAKPGRHRQRAQRGEIAAADDRPTGPTQRLGSSACPQARRPTSRWQDRRRSPRPVPEHAAPATKAGRPHDAFLPKQPAVLVAGKPEVTTGKMTVGRSREDKKWADDRKARPLLQSGATEHRAALDVRRGKSCLEIGKINVRGVVKARAAHRGGDEQPEQGLFPARKRSRLQRLRSQNHGRLGGISGDSAG